MMGKKGRKELEKAAPKSKKKKVEEEVAEPAKEGGQERKIQNQRKPSSQVNIEAWKPKTTLGRKVKAGEITDLNQILGTEQRIMEAEIVDLLLPNHESDLLLIGQSKGKFGGGQRRVFRQTQKKTKEGNKPKFSTYAIVGNLNGIVGMGYGKAKETVPAREKAVRNAKLNLIKIRRGCGSWQCNCKTPHTLPFMVEGKCGSVRIKLIPAPKGTGLIVESECKKILRLAGITDVWSKTIGKTETRMNFMIACFEALRRTTDVKIQPEAIGEIGIVEGTA